MHLYKKIVVFAKILVLNVIASTHLVTQFVATILYLFPIYFPIGFIGPTNQIPIS
jgi:hypothetical protein